LKQLIHRSEDLALNLASIEHILHPEKFICRASGLLEPDGALVISAVNGAIGDYDCYGKPKYQFHHKLFCVDSLGKLLSSHFNSLLLYGQWLTHQGMLRKRRSRQSFEHLCEIYYNPAIKLGRCIKRALGKKVLPPPAFHGASDSFDGDYIIHPLNAQEFPWEPETLIVVASR
jgi:hypothetical protein